MYVSLPSPSKTPNTRVVSKRVLHGCSPCFSRSSPEALVAAQTELESLHAQKARAGPRGAAPRHFPVLPRRRPPPASFSRVFGIVFRVSQAVSVPCQSFGRAPQGRSEIARRAPADTPAEPPMPYDGGGAAAAAAAAAARAPRRAGARRLELGVSRSALHHYRGARH